MVSGCSAPARALAARRRDQAQRETVEEQPRRYAGVAQHPLQAPVGRRFQSVSGARDAVEVLAGLAHLDEKLPGGRIGRTPPRLRAHREVGAQSPTGIGQRRFELGRNRRLVRTGIADRRETPTEHGRGEGPEVRQPGLRFVPSKRSAVLRRIREGAAARRRLADRVPHPPGRAPARRQRARWVARNRSTPSGRRCSVPAWPLTQPGLRRPADAPPPAAPSRSG